MLGLELGLGWSWRAAGFGWEVGERGASGASGASGAQGQAGQVGQCIPNCG